MWKYFLKIIISGKTPPPASTQQLTVILSQDPLETEWADLDPILIITLLWFISMLMPLSFTSWAFACLLIQILSSSTYFKLSKSLFSTTSFTILALPFSRLSSFSSAILSMSLFETSPPLFKGSTFFELLFPLTSQLDCPSKTTDLLYI